MFQLSDDFLDGLGIDGLPRAEKDAYLVRLGRVFEQRVSVRLATGLTDDQLAEFSRRAPAETDSPEVAAQKNTQLIEWFKQARPDYQDVIKDELAALKRSMLIQTGNLKP